jgi:hypothetical protein
MDPNTIKAILLLAAYEGAVAVCGPLTEAGGAKIEPDPLIQDAGLRKKGLCVYEEAKVQYAALVRAFEDKTGIWPDPKVNSVHALKDMNAPSPNPVASVAKAVADTIAVLPLPGKELVK